MSEYIFILVWIGSMAWVINLTDSYQYENKNACGLKSSTRRTFGGFHLQEAHIRAVPRIEGSHG